MPVTLWSETAIAAPLRPAITSRRTADVCIVGGGVGGVAAGYFLAVGGASVVLLEANRIGCGAVGKSSGFANAGLWVPPADILRAIGSTYGPRLIRALNDAPGRTFSLIEELGLDCDARHDGTLQCASDAAAFADLKERLTAAGGSGQDFHLADAAETARLTGTRIYRGALIDYRAGVLHPLSFARSLAAAAERSGLAICEQSPATGFDRVDGRWIVQTPNGEVATKWLLITSEAHMIGCHFGLSAEYVPMPYFNAATRPLTSDEQAQVMPAGQPIVDLRRVVSSCRYDAHRRLVIGSIGAVAGLDGAVNRDWIRRKIGRMFPILKGIEIDHVWSGIIGVTGNHMPTVHGIGEQAYALGGYNGRGIAAGTVLGEQLTEVILGAMPEADMSVPVTQPGVARFAALRGTGLRMGAAAYHAVEGRLF